MCQIGPCLILWVEFDYRAPMDKVASSGFGSLLHPYWRENEAQLTKKQVVLLMHDIYLTDILSILGNERLVKSGGSLRNTNWNGDKPPNASETKVFIMYATVVANNGNICPSSHRCFIMILLIVHICLSHLLLQ